MALQPRWQISPVVAFHSMLKKNGAHTETMVLLLWLWRFWSRTACDDVPYHRLLLLLLPCSTQCARDATSAVAAGDCTRQRHRATARLPSTSMPQPQRCGTELDCGGVGTARSVAQAARAVAGVAVKPDSPPQQCGMQLWGTAVVALPAALPQTAKAQSDPCSDSGPAARTSPCGGRCCWRSDCDAAAAAAAAAATTVVTAVRTRGALDLQEKALSAAAAVAACTSADASVVLSVAVCRLLLLLLLLLHEQRRAL